MQFTAAQIAQLIGGSIEGDANAAVNDFAKIEQGREGCISFLANPKYTSYVYDCQSSIILVSSAFVAERPVKATLIRVDNPYEAMARLMQAYEQMKPKQKGISSLAYIAETAKIGKDVYIAPFVFIGDNAVVGDRVELHPHATIEERASVGNDTIMYSNTVVYHDCQIGNHCILHAGCVIGADGFGFAPNENGYEKIPQLGNVIVEDNVEIGANTCIDRSTMGSTIVHQGVKLDNLVQLAHNTEVGSHTVMSAQTGVAGSTKVGQWCTFGGQTGISGHAVIADHVTTGGQTGVINSIRKPNTAYMGTPAIDFHNFYRSSAAFRQLPEMFRELNSMRKEIEALKNQLQQCKDNAH